jgi:linoleoyl-CoA desaturase
MNIPVIKFAKDHNEEFYKVLKQRVNEYFKSTGKTRHGNFAMVIKTIFMIALYFVPFISLLTVDFIKESAGLTVLMWAIMGMGMAGIGLSIMHDANHNAYSKNMSVNNALGHIICFIGGINVNWKIQHNVLHHTYTNVTGMDEDIDPGIIMRFSPHEKRYSAHKFQHLYAWFFYGLMTLSWATNKDWKQLFRYKKMELLETQGVKFLPTLIFLIVTKLAYYALFIGLPLMISPLSWWATVLSYLLMQFICGLILGLIFQPAHVVPSSNYPMPDNSGNIEADWAVNQLYNTANFAPGARILSWYVGGLNYQVEHHLFPNICHIHYRKLSKIVRETAEEYKLPYNSEKTFMGAIVKHGKMLYDLGHYDNAPALH